MTTRFRAVLTVVIASVPIALISGCGTSTGSDEGARATLQYTPGTSYGLKEPATTTTTTTTIAPESPIVGGTSPTEQNYEIQGGDSLFKISQLFEVTPDLICTYNGWSDCIDPPHLLLPGDVILIPPGSQVPGVASDGTTGEADTIDSDTDGAAADEQIACEHEVVAGDTPIRVAEKYDVELRELELANLSNPAYTSFLIGSKLNIPASGNC